MIKLRITDAGHEREMHFTKRVISLGPVGSKSDIVLQAKDLENPHIVIEETNGRYAVINTANSPATRFNGLPFGKRTLLAGAAITIGDTTIHVEYVDDLIEEGFARPLPQVVEEAPKAESVKVPKKPIQKEIKKKTSFRGFQVALFSLVIFIFAATGIVGGIYLSSTVQNEEEELLAARGLSDTAIALLYAKIHQINPPNNNWSDPHFIQSILGKVITKGKDNFSNIDFQGRFKNIPYILRIYTNDDASRFLLVAQPEPNFMGWFHPKEAIVVDSTQMELRRISDIQPINRLIFDCSDLCGQEQKRLSLLVKEGDLIPLSRLDNRDSQTQFSPPSELALVAPGAENYLYNSPRYYKLTEPILVKSLDAPLEKEAETELQKILGLKSPVFYTSEGMKTAVKGYRSLHPLCQDKNLHLAYFVYNTKTHIPERAELLVMSSPPQPKKEVVSKEEHLKVQPTLYKTLAKLNADRKRNLAEVSDKITELLTQNNLSPAKAFKKDLLAQLKEYERIDIDEQRKISQALSALYSKQVVQDKEISIKDFTALVADAGLSLYMHKKNSEKKNLLKSATGKVLVPSNMADPL